MWLPCRKMTLYRPIQPRISTLAVIPHGEAGTLATLEIMARVVRESRIDARLRDTALCIIAHVPSKNTWQEAEAVQEWIRDNIRYTSDVWDVETLQDPITLLQSRNGDCDDMSTLAATLLNCIGVECRFIAVAFNFEEYSHVLPQARIGGKWVTVETTENVTLGWYPPDVTKQLVVAI